LTRRFDIRARRGAARLAFSATGLRFDFVRSDDEWLISLLDGD
jgi:hypothetical protein